MLCVFVAARTIPQERWEVYAEREELAERTYRYEVFDVIVELLLANGGRARKGSGRNFKLGDPDCGETTVVGAVAARYAKKEPGDSVYDPVFVLAAVLEWAGIATNERGEIVLTASYRGKLSCGI